MIFPLHCSFRQQLIESHIPSFTDSAALSGLGAMCLVTTHGIHHSPWLLAAIVVYDALLCIAREKACIWPQRLSAGSIIYYINRYAIIMVFLSMTVFVRDLNKTASNVLLAQRKRY